jgi:flagellar biosynthesis protein FlhG
MNHDQALQLRQLVSERAPGRAFATASPAAAFSAGQLTVPLVAVHGTRGSGTTSMALNLAVALARQGRRAVYVDADFSAGPHARVPSDHNRGTIADVLMGRLSLHEVLARGPFGVQLVPGAGIAELELSAAAHNHLIRELDRLAPHADVIVVDTGELRGNFVRRCWQAARAVCVVTTPADASVIEGYRSIKLMSQEDASTALFAIVNQADEPTSDQAIYTRMATACQRFLGLKLTSLEIIPKCDALSDRLEPCAVRVGEAAHWFDQSAETLWAQLQFAETLTHPREHWSRA